MTQLEMFPVLIVTAHVRQPDNSWQVHTVDNVGDNLCPQTIKQLYKDVKELFPNTSTFIQIQYV